MYVNKRNVMTHLKLKYQENNVITVSLTKKLGVVIQQTIIFTRIFSFLSVIVGLKCCSSLWLVSNIKIF